MDYNRLLNKHLYNFVKDVLDSVISTGLSGNHHLVITFSTNHLNTVISQSLRRNYPDEMTIILDEEFYNLQTSDTGFSVVLFFETTTSEEIFVPYSAIICFEDPSCNFSIDLETDLSNIATQDYNNIISFKDLQQ